MKRITEAELRAIRGGGTEEEEDPISHGGSGLETEGEEDPHGVGCR